MHACSDVSFWQAKRDSRHRRRRRRRLRLFSCPHLRGGFLPAPRSRYPIASTTTTVSVPTH